MGEPHCDGWFLRLVIGQVGEPHCNGWFPRLVMCHMGEPHCDGWFPRLVTGQVGEHESIEFMNDQSSPAHLDLPKIHIDLPTP